MEHEDYVTVVVGLPPTPSGSPFARGRPTATGSLWGARRKDPIASGVVAPVGLSLAGGQKTSLSWGSPRGFPDTQYSAGSSHA